MNHTNRNSTLLISSIISILVLIGGCYNTPCRKTFIEKGKQQPRICITFAEPAEVLHEEKQQIEKIISNSILPFFSIFGNNVIIHFSKIKIQSDNSDFNVCISNAGTLHIITSDTRIAPEVTLEIPSDGEMLLLATYDKSEYRRKISN